MSGKKSLIQLTPEISYLPASTNPLSCDVVFIKTDKATWIFDVGTCKAAREEINKVEGPKNIVLSHFHPDHIMNLLLVKNYDNLYVSRNTKKYTRTGTVLENKLVINEKPQITIFELPSSHAKGCLCVMCQDYAFLGDGTYCKERIGNHTYNAQLLKAEIEVLESLPVKYFGLDHSREFIQQKETVIELHKDIYSRKEANNPVISVEDYFNPDGSVKEDV